MKNLIAMILLAVSMNATAEVKVCVPDKVMKISANETELYEEVSDISGSTQILTVSNNEIIVSSTENEISFPKVNKYIYAGDWGAILLVPKKKMVISTYRILKTGETFLQTVSYNCSNLPTGD